MKVLVVGGGGREHAIVWKLAQSPKMPDLYCAPGNAGIAKIATCVPIKATDIAQMVDYAVQQAFDLVVVAPDDPLAMGLVDALIEKGILAFGPTASAARIESSKAFAKDIMRRAGIPTADYQTFDDVEKALAYVDTCCIPTVVKADGLALGKGVVICHTRDEARRAVLACMQNAAFGAAGSRIVIEDFMTGPEMTVLAFSDGKTVLPMISSQDHKRALDGDEGLNTGGMGTVAPALHETQEVLDFVTKQVLEPCINTMLDMGFAFAGVLYAGLMLTPNGVKVIEFNARFGDPETQVVLPLLETDLLDVFLACAKGTLDQIQLVWSRQHAVCVVLASGGYPEKYDTGFEMTGLENAQKKALVFHAGTRQQGDAVVTSGGRVLGVTGIGDTVEAARNEAYEAVKLISFHGMHYRKDIATR